MLESGVHIPDGHLVINDMIKFTILDSVSDSVENSAERNPHKS